MVAWNPVIRQQGIQAEFSQLNLLPGIKILSFYLDPLWQNHDSSHCQNRQTRLFVLVASIHTVARDMKTKDGPLIDLKPKPSDKMLAGPPHQVLLFRAVGLLETREI